jgi:hypothetical protein
VIGSRWAAALALFFKPCTRSAMRCCLPDAALRRGGRLQAWPAACGAAGAAPCTIQTTCRGTCGRRAVQLRGELTPRRPPGRRGGPTGGSSAMPACPK